MFKKRKKPSRSLTDSLNNHHARYLENMSCGFCFSTGSLKRHSNYPSLEVSETTLYICKNCTTIYNSTTELKRLENETSQIEWLKQQEFYSETRDPLKFQILVEESSKIFEWFSNQFKYDFVDKSFFEIGAGSGASSIAASRLFKKCTSTDLSLDRLQQAKNISKSSNLDLCKIENLGQVTFDFFFAWHVFEHLINPGEVFETVFKHLNPDGVFFIQVPLITERYIHPSHTFLFNEYAWTNILAKLPVKEQYFFYDKSLCAMTLVVFKK